MYVIRINGTPHTVNVLPDGTKEYDPPLPDDRLEKDKRNIKEMCKAQQAPGLRTDTGWHAGRGTLLDQMDGDEVWTKHIVQQAKKHGYTPGANDVYIGQLADFAGDPKGFFKPSEGRKELEKRLKKTGKGCDIPGLKVEAKPYVEKQGPQLNAKVAKALEKQYVANGLDKGMSKKELRQHIVQKHGYSLGSGKLPKLGS